MARSGRKRKVTGREPSGAPQRACRAERRDAVMGTAMEQPHRRWLPEASRLDQRAESALGRLFLAGLITEPECWAGERFRTLLREFHVVMASPVTVSTAAVMVANGVETPAEADHLAAERPETEEERAERVLRMFGSAKQRLSRLECGGRAVRDIDALVMRDVVPHRLDAVRAGLRALAKMWHMDDVQEDYLRRSEGYRSGTRPEWPHEECEVEIVYK